jgi:hypothetical protein
MSPDVFDEALATIKAAVAGVQAEIRRQDAALAERETRIAGLEATAKDLAAHIAADQNVVRKAEAVRQQARAFLRDTD